jgi:hypothetical protein
MKVYAVYVEGDSQPCALFGASLEAHDFAERQTFPAHVMIEQWTREATKPLKQAAPNTQTWKYERRCNGVGCRAVIKTNREEKRYCSTKCRTSKYRQGDPEMP